MPGKHKKIIRLTAAILVSICGLSSAQELHYRPVSPAELDALDHRLVRQDVPDINPVPAREKKSVSRAFFYSLLLPGTGEAYVGKTGYTKFFLSVETIGWGLFIANSLQVSSREEDYQNYAVQHAGIDRSGKEDQYWIDIGKFDTIYEYNEQRRRDRNIDALYPESPDFAWRWDAEDNRLFYDAYRIDTRKIEDRQVYIFGVIILNHLASAINALRLARAYNRDIEELSWRFDVDYNIYSDHLSFSIGKSF